MHELIVWTETPYLECRLFVYGFESPSLLVPCSKPAAPIETPSPCCRPFPCPLPANMMVIHIQTTLTRLILLLSGTLSNTEHEI